MTAYHSDTSIADDILQALAAVLPGIRISVLVHDGRVTLRGVVAEPATRRTLKDVVGDVEGVNAITDLTTLHSGAAASAVAQPPFAVPRAGKRPASCS